MAGSRETQTLLRNVDERLQRVEQFLPTFVTKEELRAEVAKLATKEELRAEVAKLATKEELRAEVAKLATKEELRDESDRTRRHMGVLVESLRDDIRIVAEGQVALARRVDDIYAELKENDARLDRRVMRLEAQEDSRARPPQ
jgi:hypothetical protein